MPDGGASTFLRRSKTVDTLAEAWAFIMAEVDRFPRPTIEIQAVIEFDEIAAFTKEPGIDRYRVTIYGDVT